MVGLREKKKKRTREKIIKTAKEIILDKGYNDTTMEEIAERAEIGVGTLYNYFKSKAEIFVSVMSEEILIDEEDSEQLGHDLEENAAEVVINYLWKFARGMKIVNKKVWRELFTAMFGSSDTANLMFKGMMNLDFKFIDRLENLLENIKEKKMLPEDFNTHEAAYNIYSIILTQTIIYVYMKDIDFEDYTDRIEKQIYFMFEGKCSL